MIKVLNMSDGDIQMQQLRALFRDQNQRSTPQKEAVWRLFADSSRGYTLPEACEALKDQGIGQATVYRMVNLLRDNGFLEFVHMQDGKHRYLAGSADEHVHHVICRSCGALQTVTDCELTVLEKLISLQTGFVVEGHHLEFYGLCPKCSLLSQQEHAHQDNT